MGIARDITACKQASVHSIVECLGGKITVDSQWGKGSTFTIYLSGTQKLSVRSPSDPERLPSGAERILIVDDELAITKMSGKKISDEIAWDIGIKAFAYKPMVRADLAKTVRKVLDDAKANSSANDVKPKHMNPLSVAGLTIEKGN
jgi:hypothetical protein